MSQETARPSDLWLLRLLANQGTLSGDVLEDVRRRKPLYASEELVGKGLLTQEQIGRLVSERYAIPYASPEASALERMALSLMPEAVCRRYTMIPLDLAGESIRVLMANPIDVVAQDEASAVTGRRLMPVYCLPRKIEELIAAVFRPDAVVAEILKRFPENAEVECIPVGEEGRTPVPAHDPVTAPVIQLANALIMNAVRSRASDIHVEHDESSTLIRYRVDGTLKNVITLPKHLGEGPLVSRIKIMGNLDVADRRRPQDGRAKLKVAGEEIGLRISTLPTSFGEKVVLRILDRRQAKMSLDDLGFRPEICERLKALSAFREGVLLLTGPTGSGKTTTLYSILNRLKSEDVNVMTVEDPVEYRLEGINQVQVNEKAGLGFAAVLRSVLRQDPDVILVGEIRDRETAGIALQAALTGHMVLSTLHTNDALSTVTRLLDMGAERYALVPALLGVVSQRLVRRICPDCAKPRPMDPSVKVLLEEAGLPQTHFKGEGCEKCGYTGLIGRTALSEILDLSPQEARDRLFSMDEKDFRKVALERRWLMTLRHDALWHLAHGYILLEEAAPFLSASEGRTGPEQVEPAAVVRPPVHAVAPGAPPSILVVDDVADNRAVVRDALSGEGYRLREAENGVQALQEISREKPDLVLLDMLMPEMDGFTVIRRLREDLGMADLPILVLTALGESESQVLTLQLGADDYLTKPFNPKLLKARIVALFRRYGKPAAPAHPAGTAAPR